MKHGKQIMLGAKAAVLNKVVREGITDKALTWAPGQNTPLQPKDARAVWSGKAVTSHMWPLSP